MTNLNPTLRQTARAFATALILGFSFLGFAVEAAEPPAVQGTLQAASAEPSAREATQLETDAYAGREQQASATLAEFQGGDTVVGVGTTTLVIILLIVLIIVLI